MSLMKHFGEQGDAHQGNLFWSQALNGLPFRGGNAPILNQQELDTQVSVNFDFHSEFFDISQPEAHDKFNWVMDRIVNKWFCLHYIERKVVAESKTTLIYLEWSQRYGELSPAARAARSQGYVFPNTSPTSFNLPLAGLQDPANH
jgi:hypothetical protein